MGVISLLLSFALYSQEAKPQTVKVKTNHKVFTCEINFQKGIQIKHKSKLIQTIPIEESAQTIDPENMIQVEDFNFDGFKDISVATMATAKNVFVDVYLFDPSKDRFMKSSVLSEVPTPSVDAKLKQLSTYNNDGAAGLTYTANTFKIEKNNPVLFRTEVQSLSSNDTDYTNFTRTVEERVNGKMVVICKLALKHIEGNDNAKITKVEKGDCKKCKSEGEVCPKK